MQYPEHQNSNANEGKSYENTHSSLYLVLFLFVVLFVGAGFLGIVITTSDSSESRQELNDLAAKSDSELEVKSLEVIDTKVVDTAISSLESWSEYNSALELSRHRFEFKGEVGVVIHTCLSKEIISKETLPVGGRFGGVYCPYKNLVVLEFNGEEIIIDTFDPEVEEEYKAIHFLGFTQDVMQNTSQSEFITTSENQNDRLMVGLYYDECDFNNEVCWSVQTLTHLISLPDGEVNTLQSPISNVRGLTQSAWNPDRTALVLRSAGHDIKPTFYGVVIGQSDIAFRFGGEVKLSQDLSGWSEEEQVFSKRMWDENEVTWLDNNLVQIYDTVFELDI